MKRSLFLLPLCCLLVACGSAEETGPSPSNLLLRIAPDGSDFSSLRISCPSEDINESAICGQLDLLPRSSFNPPPKDQICTRIYGGPLKAFASGTFRGQKIDASFNLSGGCEIERFQQVKMLYRYAFPTLPFSSVAE